MVEFGGIYKIHVNFTEPPKLKYVICVHVTEYLFLLINSEPRKRGEGAQLPITPEDLDYLKSNSYIDVSKLVRLTPNIYKDQFENPDNRIGVLTKHMRIKLKLLIENNKYLSKVQIEKLIAELSGE